MVAMDGNFSQKRLKCAKHSPLPYDVKSVSQLWGKGEEIKEQEEIEKARGKGKEDNDEDCVSIIRVSWLPIIFLNCFVN